MIYTERTTGFFSLSCNIKIPSMQTAMLQGKLVFFPYLVTYRLLTSRTPHSEFACYASSEGPQCFHDIIRSWYLIEGENKTITHPRG